jgi:hypothetical protein
MRPTCFGSAGETCTVQRYWDLWIDFCSRIEGPCLRMRASAVVNKPRREGTSHKGRDGKMSRLIHCALSGTWLIGCANRPYQRPLVSHSTRPIRALVRWGATTIANVLVFPSLDPESILRSTVNVSLTFIAVSWLPLSLLPNCWQRQNSSS